MCRTDLLMKAWVVASTIIVSCFFYIIGVSFDFGLPNRIWLVVSEFVFLNLLAGLDVVVKFAMDLLLTCKFNNKKGNHRNCDSKIKP